MSKYIVNLEEENEDEFELEGKNVAQVQVLNAKGNDITNNCIVVLELSQDGKHIHLTPSSKEFITQSLGIYLTSNSCELIVSCNEFGKIEEHIEP